MSKNVSEIYEYGIGALMNYTENKPHVGLRTVLYEREVPMITHVRPRNWHQWVATDLARQSNTVAVLILCQHEAFSRNYPKAHPFNQMYTLQSRLYRSSVDAKQAISIRTDCFVCKTSSWKSLTPSTSSSNVFHQSPNSKHFVQWPIVWNSDQRLSARQIFERSLNRLTWFVFPNFDDT